jgi:K+-sensing histidine kinase KdpD
MAVTDSRPQFAAPPSSRGFWVLARDHLLALVSVAVAVLLRVWLDPVLGDRSVFLLCVFAVLIAAAAGGIGPALIATLASVLGQPLYF